MKDKVRVLFYHFTVTPLALGLSRLIKKIYDTKKNLLVLCKNEMDMNELDKTVWTFSSREFIPHGTINDSDLELQPVLLSTEVNNQNNAEILLSSRDDVADQNLTFKQYLYAFYGNVNEVQHMMDSYKEYKMRQDVDAVFWKQDRSGKWSTT